MDRSKPSRSTRRSSVLWTWVIRQRETGVQPLRLAKRHGFQPYLAPETHRASRTIPLNSDLHADASVEPKLLSVNITKGVPNGGCT